MLSLAVSACMSAPERHSSDGNVDASVADARADGATGSAARSVLGTIEASPKDNQLELGVFVVSLVVALAPLAQGRRRRHSA
jgi:hypothetical protein